MSLRQTAPAAHVTTRQESLPIPDVCPPCLPLSPGVVTSRPATDEDRAYLAQHIGRKAIQATRDRSFYRGWRPGIDGARTAKLYRIGTPQLARCQYAILRHKQRAAVFTVDVDRPGLSGGAVESINPDTHALLDKLASAGAGPSWIGVNPLTGKTHLLWMIDPVYADASGDSAPMRLYEATWKTFRNLLGGDPAFSNWWMRSPFHTGDDLGAYVWHCQHHRVDNLAALIQEAREMSDVDDHDPEPVYRSGKEFLEAAIARRKEAEAFADIVKDVAEDIPDVTGEKIDGVRIRWADAQHTRADRDETAFRHALAEAHRLRSVGKRMSDEAIIDAYERAYAVAQAVGADGRVQEMPPMRDRLTMARRVRGYVVAGKRSERSSAPTGRASGSERKALSTLGRKGGEKAAQRWKTDPDGDYARGRRETLAKTHRRQRGKGQGTRGRIQAFIGQQYAETGTMPTRREIAAEVGCTPRTVTTHLAALREAGFLPGL